jgi:hypothetical protein
VQLRCLDRPVQAKRAARLLSLQKARNAVLHRGPGPSPGELPREGT